MEEDKALKMLKVLQVPGAGRTLGEKAARVLWVVYARQ